MARPRLVDPGRHRQYLAVMLDMARLKDQDTITN
jgi:hypothetical protein